MAPVKALSHDEQFLDCDSTRFTYLVNDDDASFAGHCKWYCGRLARVEWRCPQAALNLGKINRDGPCTCIFTPHAQLGSDNSEDTQRLNGGEEANAHEHGPDRVS